MSRGRQRGRGRATAPARNNPRGEEAAPTAPAVMHDAMKPKYELEDYIYSVESRSLEPSVDPEDVYAQLQQKEKDLILAAEVGKALLEKNEELSRQNELLAEDYSHKLEDIEQDRHLLRRKLATSQAEYETRVVELQADISQLEAELCHRENNIKQTERQKNSLIAELTEQNHRLTAQIKESAKLVEQLTMQLQGLKEQATQRKSSFQDHQSSLDLLKDEISLLSDKKGELERRLKRVKEQRDALSAALDEATDRIMILERQMREQQIHMRVSDTELQELRSCESQVGWARSSNSTSNNPWERSSTTNTASSSSPEQTNRSLHSEMECDQSLHSLPLGDEHHQLKVEIVSVYDRVRALRHSLKQRMNPSGNSATAAGGNTSAVVRPDITVHQVKVGLLTSVIEEICELVCELRLQGGANNSAGSNSNSSLTDLEIELHRAQEALDKTAKEMESKSEELKRRNETIMDLTSKMSVMEAELSGCREERDRAREDVRQLVGGEGGPEAGPPPTATEEMLLQAWQVRDRAVQRKNAAMVELARTRIEVMQANSQLMEAIQQKIELSQQLDQWQMDMEALLDEQMRRKLMCPDYDCGSGQNSPATPSGLGSPPANAPSAAPKRPPRRLFGIFPR